MSQSPALGAVELGRLLHRDAAAEIFAGVLIDGRTRVLATVGRRRLQGSARDVFLDWGSRLTRLATHPHIAPISAVGLTEHGRPYLAVESTRSSLADVLRESGPPPAGQVRALGVALADTLACIHAAGLFHGALLPSTVLSGPGRKLLMAGFDLTAPALATPLRAGPFTPPEHLESAQAGAVRASPAGDVYSLACLLYGALGGRLPWFASDGQDPADPLLRAAPLPDIPGVSQGLTDVLGAALHPDPRRRPEAARLRSMLSDVDVARPLKVGRRPAHAAPELTRREGLRPGSLPPDAAVAVRPKRRSDRRFRLRLSRPVKLAAVAATAFLSVAGAGWATFAATHADASQTCPDAQTVSAAVQQSHPEAEVMDFECVENGDVEVLADLDPDAGRIHRLTLRSEQNRLVVVEVCAEPSAAASLSDRESICG